MLVACGRRRWNAWGAVRCLSGRVLRLDYKKIARDPGVVLCVSHGSAAASHALNARNRNCDADPTRITQLHEQYTAQLHELEKMNQRRHELAKLIPAAKDETAKVTLKTESHQLKQAIAHKSAALEQSVCALEVEAAKLPNETSPQTPIGPESAAVVNRSWGECRPRTEGQPAYGELCARWNWLDFAGAANCTGEGFVFLKNDLALLEVALVQHAMHSAMRAGFDVHTTPDVVKCVPLRGFVRGAVSSNELASRESVLEDCGFRPRSSKDNQVYHIEGEPFALAGTSEITLAGMHAGTILKGLPKKLCGFSHCFRREASSSGRAGTLYRLHQFSKVELFCFCTPANSPLLFDELVAFQCSMLESLGLPYRVLEMPSEELGLSAYRKVDCEVWMPSLEAFGEVSSASNCTDFQARRLDMRYQVEVGNNPFVHTLNATALAVPRILIGILENHYSAERDAVVLPQCLQGLMGTECIPRALSRAH